MPIRMPMSPAGQQIAGGISCVGRWFKLKDMGFGLATLILILLAHAAAYLTHEYAHSVMAWCLGWMDRPFGIDYGSSTLDNWIFLGDVSDNVEYAPIFAAGHGLSAALIALSGPFIGNGVLYFVAYALASANFVRRRWAGLSVVYWYSLMCAANVWSYVPLRAITTHADIAIAAKGLGLSTWVLLPFLLVPSLYVTYHFFCRMYPKVQNTLAGGSLVRSVMLIALTAFWYFSFFSGDGISGSYGLVSQVLSIVSRYLCLPLAVMFLTARHGASDKLPEKNLSDYPVPVKLMTS